MRGHRPGRRRALAVGGSLALLAVLALAGCGRDGEARAHLARALAHLDAGRLADASDAADRAAAVGGDDVRAACDFVRGNVAFGRSRLLEADAGTPGAPLTTLELSLAQAEDALAAWRAAAATRADWPAARRNVERALLRIEGLRARLGRKREGTRPPPPAPGAKPLGPPPTDAPPIPAPPVRPPVAPPAAAAPPRPIVTTDLPAAEVRGLLDVLRRKEQEKRAMRRARTAPPASATERDW